MLFAGGMDADFFVNGVEGEELGSGCNVYTFFVVFLLLPSKKYCKPFTMSPNCHVS